MEPRQDLGATTDLTTDVEEQVEQPHEQQGPGPEERDTDRPAAPTGHPRVDEVIASLDRLDELAVSEHVAVFEAAHAGLRDALARAADG
ncbi:MAG TPA: hypothetical protein VFJ09_13700 [Nocardioidaceae bacterium]|nr:hypothetical protein [Nocardioidaceae bacterium]